MRPRTFQPALVAGLITLKNPRNLSLTTALSLFRMRIAPVASYGIQIIWKHLTLYDLIDLDKVKSRFLKRTLGVHKTARSRLVYLLTNEISFVEELRNQFDLEETQAYEQFIIQFHEKQLEIDP